MQIGNRGSDWKDFLCEFNSLCLRLGSALTFGFMSGRCLGRSHSHFEECWTDCWAVSRVQEVLQPIYKQPTKTARTPYVREAVFQWEHETSDPIARSGSVAGIHNECVALSKWTFAVYWHLQQSVKDCHLARLDTRVGSSWQRRIDKEEVGRTRRVDQIQQQNLLHQ